MARQVPMQPAQPLIDISGVRPVEHARRRDGRAWLQHVGEPVYPAIYERDLRHFRKVQHPGAGPYEAAH